MKSPRTLDPHKLSASTKALNPHLFSPQTSTEATPSPLVKKKVSGQPKPMTKPERLYGIILERSKHWGEIDDYEFEGLKLKIGSDTCWYIPDWVFWKDGKTHIREVKGPFVREDSIIKFKCAKEKFKHFDFQMFQLGKDGEWTQLL